MMIGFDARLQIGQNLARIERDVNTVAAQGMDIDVDKLNFGGSFFFLYAIQMFGMHASHVLLRCSRHCVK